MFQPKLVLCDLDGTLVDSVPDLAFAVDEMLKRLNMPMRGEAAVRTWVGNGINMLVARALANDMAGQVETALLEQALPLYKEVYGANVSKRSYVYPGVLEGLAYLRNCSELKVGCVTNKSEQFTQPLLKDLGLRDLFEIVICGDTLPEKKPHPLPLLHAAQHFNFAPQDCLMLGDSKSDVKAARAAGFKVICVSYGYNHGEDIRHYHPDAVIDSFTELSNWIQCAHSPL